MGRKKVEGLGKIGKLESTDLEISIEIGSGKVWKRWKIRWGSKRKIK